MVYKGVTFMFVSFAQCLKSNVNTSADHWFGSFWAPEEIVVLRFYDSALKFFIVRSWLKLIGTPFFFLNQFITKLFLTTHRRTCSLEPVLEASRPNLIRVQARRHTPNAVMLVPNHWSSPNPQRQSQRLIPTSSPVLFLYPAAYSNSSSRTWCLSPHRPKPAADPQRRC